MILCVFTVLNMFLSPALTRTDKFWSFGYKDTQMGNTWNNNGNQFDSTLSQCTDSLILSGLFSNSESTGKWPQDKMGVLIAAGSNQIKMESEQKDSQVHPLCQIEPSSSSPHCPQNYFLLQEWCYHIVKHKKTYEKAKQHCEMHKHQGKSAHLVSDLTCMDAERLQEVLNLWKNEDDENFCGDCCPVGTKVYCLNTNDGDYTHKKVKDCTCSCSICNSTATSSIAATSASTSKIKPVSSSSFISVSSPSTSNSASSSFSAFTLTSFTLTTTSQSTVTSPVFTTISTATFLLTSTSFPTYLSGISNISTAISTSTSTSTPSIKTSSVLSSISTTSALPNTSRFDTSTISSIYGVIPVSTSYSTPVPVIKTTSTATWTIMSTTTSKSISNSKPIFNFPYAITSVYEYTSSSAPLPSTAMSNIFFMSTSLATSSPRTSSASLPRTSSLTTSTSSSSFSTISTTTAFSAPMSLMIKTTSTASSTTSSTGMSTVTSTYASSVSNPIFSFSFSSLKSTSVYNMHTSSSQPSAVSSTISACTTNVSAASSGTSTTTGLTIKTTTPTVIIPLSTTPDYPLTEMEELVADVMQGLGCVFILCILGVTILTYWILCDWSYERFLHMNQEIALFLAHILILFLRDKTNMLIPCKLAAVGLQFFFIATFAFMVLEALQTYAVMTNVILSNGYFSRFQFFLIGWLGSGLLTVVASVWKHQEYISIWSCWLNLGNNVSMATIGPIVILSALAIIMTEAAAMGDFQPLPDTNRDQATAAIANQKGLLIIIPLSTIAWFMGLFAVYYVNLALYSIVAALNISLGTSVFVFHTLGNPKVHSIFKKLMEKICKKSNNSGDD